MVDYERIVRDAAARHGVDPRIGLAIWEQEFSRNTDPAATGPVLPEGHKYAGHYPIGPFQIMSFHPDVPDTFEGQADWAMKHLKERGIRGYYGTGQPLEGHPTTDEYVAQVMAKAANIPLEAENMNDPWAHLSNEELQAIANQGQASPYAHLSDEELRAIAGKDQPSIYERQAQADPWWVNALAGYGGATQGMINAVKQRLNIGDQGELERQERERREAMSGLRTTPGGMGGEIAGVMAPAATTMALPGGASLTGAALTGAGFGALEPVLDDESVLENMATGGVFGLGGQAVGNLAFKTGGLLTEAIADRAASRLANVTRDQTLNAAKSAGYVFPPSTQNAGLVSRSLEGLSGKYKTNQLAAIKNQNTTQRLAKEAIGLPKESPLDIQQLRSVRQNAFLSGYAPIIDFGIGPARFPTSKAYMNALDNVAREYRGAAKSFPKGAPQDLLDMIDNLKVKAFDTGDALDKIRTLRNDASDYFARGEGKMGRAAREAAGVIEDEIERMLSARGAEGVEYLQRFRDARKLIAKTHSIEEALEPGSGMVNARKLANQLGRGEPLSGELELIAKTGNAFGDVMQVPKSGYANPLTWFDWTGGALGAGGMGTMNPYLMAMPAARIASRLGLLSKGAQQNVLGPRYGVGPGMRLTQTLLDQPSLPYLGGVSGLGLLNALEQQ